MKLQMTMVTWADAHSDSSGWTGKRDLDEEGEYLVHSVGWLITEEEGGKPGHVTLCQSYTPDEDVDHVLYVPHGMIRAINVLTELHAIDPRTELRYPHAREET
jgi:hypothetical protein